MAHNDINTDAGQSAYISEGSAGKGILQNAPVSDGVNGVSNSPIDDKKARVALFTGLESLMGAVEQGGSAANDSAADPNKGKLPPGSKDSDPEPPVSNKTAFTPVGLAVLEASQKFQNSSNEIIKKLADMSTEIMDVTTATAKAGADWYKNYYNYGLSSDQSNPKDGMGQWSEGTEIKGGTVDVQMKIADGNYYMSVDGGPFKSLGAVQKDSTGYVTLPDPSQITPVFPGFSFPDSAKNGNNATMWNHSGYGSKGDGQSFTMSMTAPDRTTGGTGIAGATTADMSYKLTQINYIQNTNNEKNASMQAVSALPAALDQTIAAAVDQAHSSDSATLSALATTGNLIKGWRN